MLWIAKAAGYRVGGGPSPCNSVIITMVYYDGVRRNKDALHQTQKSEIFSAWQRSDNFWPTDARQSTRR